MFFTCFLLFIGRVCLCVWLVTSYQLSINEVFMLKKLPSISTAVSALALHSFLVGSFATPVWAMEREGEMSPRTQIKKLNEEYSNLYHKTFGERKSPDVSDIKGDEKEKVEAVKQEIEIERLAYECATLEQQLKGNQKKKISECYPIKEGKNRAEKIERLKKKHEELTMNLNLQTKN